MDRAEIFKKEIAENLSEAIASTRAKKEVIHIKGIDEPTTEEEIKEAILRQRKNRQYRQELTPELRKGRAKKHISDAGTLNTKN